MRAPKTGYIAISRVIAGELARELAEFVRGRCWDRRLAIDVDVTFANSHTLWADPETGYSEAELDDIFADALEGYVKWSEPGLSAGALQARVLILSGSESVLLASIDPDRTDDFRAELALLADDVATDEAETQEVYTFDGREVALLRGGLK